MDFLFLRRPSIFSPMLPKDFLCSVQCYAVGLITCFSLMLDGTLLEDNYAQLLSESTTKNIISNIKDWCLPMGWVSSLTGYSLAIPSLSSPTFYLHFLQAGQIFGGMVICSVCVLNSQLGILPCCRMWPPQGTYFTAMDLSYHHPFRLLVALPFMVCGTYKRCLHLLPLTHAELNPFSLPYGPSFFLTPPVPYLPFPFCNY